MCISRRTKRHCKSSRPAWSEFHHRSAGHSEIWKLAPKRNTDWFEIRFLQPPWTPGPATLHEPDSHGTPRFRPKHWHGVITPLGAPYNFILQTIFFQYFIYCFKYFILWYIHVIYTLNGQSKIISKRGREGRGGDDGGRRQETSGNLKNFQAMKGVCDMPIPTMKDLGLDLRECWANLFQPPDANIHTRLGVGGYSSWCQKPLANMAPRLI